MVSVKNLTKIKLILIWPESLEKCYFQKILVLKFTMSFFMFRLQIWNLLMKKLPRLFNGLTTHLKNYFVRDKPTTITTLLSGLKIFSANKCNDQKTLSQAATNAHSVSPMVLNNPFSNTNLNQSKMLDNAALLALSNRLPSTTALLNPDIFWMIFPVAHHRVQIRWWILANERTYKAGCAMPTTINSISEPGNFVFRQIPQSSRDFISSPTTIPAKKSWKVS